MEFPFCSTDFSQSQRFIPQQSPPSAQYDQMEYPFHSTQCSQFPQFTSQPSPPSFQDEEISKKKKRTCGYSVEQDVFLVTSWLSISIDSVQRNEQKSKAYWNRISYYYHLHKKFQSDRDEKSLMQRWSKIQHGTNKFVGYFSNIEAKRRSGTNERDTIYEAKRMYEELEGKKFAFQHCRNALRYQPKFIYEYQNKKSATSVRGESSSSAPQVFIDLNADSSDNTSFVDLERPMGNKKAKRKLKDEAKEHEKTPLELMFEKIQESKSQERIEKKRAQEQKIELWRKSIEQNEMKMQDD